MTIRQRRAIHEAGHTVHSLLHDCSIFEVCLPLQKNKETGSHAWCDTDTQCLVQRCKYDEYIKALVAGDAAEAHAARIYIGAMGGSTADWNILEQFFLWQKKVENFKTLVANGIDIAQARRVSVDSDLQMDLALYDELSAIVLDARKEVLIELLANWNAVEAIALALNEKKRLNREEVMAIWARFRPFVVRS